MKTFINFNLLIWALTILIISQKHKNYTKRFATNVFKHLCFFGKSFKYYKFL